MASHYYNDVETMFDALSNPASLGVLLTTLGQFQTDKFDFDGFNLKAILQNILNRAKESKRNKAVMFKDITDIVLIGLTRGNIRQDQLTRTVSGGSDRIKELCDIYKIPMRKSKSEKVILKQDTLTFSRALTCFPHIASLLLFKAPRLAKNGVASALKTNELPSVMKHSGFAALIPLYCNKTLYKIFLMAHTAYMIDFGKAINPEGFTDIKKAYDSQLSFGIIATQNAAYDDTTRSGYLRAFDLANPEQLKIIINVANRLSKELGKGEFSYDLIKDKIVKNNIICYTDDQSAEDDAASASCELANKLNIKVTSMAEAPLITSSGTAAEPDL